MVSIGQLIYKLQEFPFLRGIKKSDIVNHIKTVLSLIGAPGLYEDKSIKLEIIDFRAQLPKDFISRIAVRRVMDTDYRIPLTHNTDDFYSYYRSLSEEEKDNVDLLYTHKIVGNFIYTDFKEGFVEIIYKSLHLDEKGLPMIDADASLELAIEWYIKQRYYEILWSTGKLPEKVYQNAVQRYYLYVGQAKNSINIPDPIEAEAIGNAIVRLIPQTDNLESAYKYDSQKERLNTNNY